jgi:hypothetical protein
MHPARRMRRAVRLGETRARMCRTYHLCLGPPKWGVRAVTGHSAVVRS